ncbi:MAG TPA: hypothetical protein VIF57_15325 [Polyangia bacterium]
MWFRQQSRPPLVMVLLLVSCATGGGGGDVVGPRADITAADYYPLADGWKWAYSVNKDGMNILATYAVRERKGGVATVQAGDEELTYVVTPEGVAQFEGNAIGDYIIKNPIKVGTEWPVTGGRARIASVEAKFASPSLGRYEGCVLVSVTRTDPMRVTQTWFAPYLGPVIIDIQAQDGNRFLPIAKAELIGVTKPGDPLATP